MTDAAPSSPRLQVRLDYDRCVNYAMQQNDVPLLQAAQITNAGAEALRDLEVWFQAGPNLSNRATVRIAELGPGASFNVERADLQLRPERLVNLVERERGTLRVCVVRHGEILLAEEHPLELLAYNEWSGASLPEILAAFVLPNHPAHNALLVAARRLLGERTGDPTLNGYQHHQPARARAMVEAVYDAARSFRLGYVNPAASFESQGQKIRLPEQVLGLRLGTCLDLATLLAGALEQVGLHPLLVLFEGHALAGAWLADESFAEPVLHDPVRLRKRVDLGEIVLFEATGVCAPDGLAFERAVRDARARLDDEAHFLHAIDVHAARRARIRPLPARADAGFDVVLTDQAEPAAGTASTAPAAPAAAPAAPAAAAPFVAPVPAPEGAAARLERWQRRLLDLSLRNRLLRFVETKRTVPLLGTDLAALEDAMQSGEEFELLERPGLFGAHDPRDRDVHAARTGEDAARAYATEQLAGQRLHADLEGPELDRRALELFRAARTSREEGGANTLFLALGFLRWFEPTAPDRPHLAPILLLPVDLTRRSMTSGFRVLLADEDVQINTTLIEKLGTELGIGTAGLDEIPTDERGVDVDAVLQRFRAAVRDAGRFEVVAQAVLGMFSFTKLLMWRDLQARAATLLRSPVVRHLVESPNAPFEPAATFVEPEALDATHGVAATFTPLDADSSQLAAVFAAAAGRSFVLEGPPGTGKSQTIANLVAQCLAEGKRVLFVSEKAAALDVVYRRLQGVGLEPFCLELHSNRATKRDVVRQLGQALEAGGGRAPEQWEARAAALQALRDELNAHARRLHARQPVGQSLYEVLTTLIELRTAPRHELALAPDAVDADRRRAIREALEALDDAARPLGSIAAHRFAAVNHDDWQPSWTRLVEGYAPKLAQAARNLDERLRELELGSLPEVENLAPLLLDAPPVPSALAAEPDWPERKRRIEAWLETGRRRDARRSELFARWEPRILTLDLAAMRAHWQRRARWWPPLRGLLLRSARAVLRPLAKTPRNVRETEADLVLGEALQQDEAALTAAAPEAKRWFGEWWRDGAPDWGQLQQAVQWADALRALPHLERNAELAAAALGSDDSPLGNRLRRFTAARVEFGSALEKLAWLKLEPQAFGGRADAEYLPRLRAAAEGWARGAASLRDWCAYLRARRAVEELGVPELARAHAAGELAGGELTAAFERSFLEAWLERQLAGDAALRGFRGEDHERLIQRFRALDQELLRLAAEVVRARLAAKLPQAGAVGGETSEVGILLRELKKQRRHLPPRQLFAKITTLLARLKPCFLMSPLSVAQYLDPATPPFDLVVFDEASQIPPWDAVGAIARGGQLVCVGDSRQLPPTSFFQKLEEDGEVDLEDTVELESILDECAAAGLPRRALRWHYRSRHESLIAFSNHHYYGNGLLTFPTPEVPGADGRHATERRLGVRLVAVPPGGYERGQEHVNRPEAELVVAEVGRRLADPAEAGRSLGIVTFSVAQQTLIEDLLERAAASRPELERALTGAHEPLFVKNLENVQGDERDVILFSVCYGPDAKGRVTMGFGPLNRQGGERRLNVAVTRAREELVVFASLRPEHIDLARTQALGARHLKTFLDYAARGPRAIGEAQARDAVAAPTAFERELQASLARRGWTVHAQVGCSGHRLDLAVVDPQVPGRYLLGIECDGGGYGSARTARDRDRLRAQVLQNLGWRLHRVWSLDFWLDPEKELEKLSTALAEAKQARAAGALARVATAPLLEREPASRAHPAPRPAPAPAPAAPAATSVPPLPPVTPAAAVPAQAPPPTVPAVDPVPAPTPAAAPPSAPPTAAPTATPTPPPAPAPTATPTPPPAPAPVAPATPPYPLRPRSAPIGDAAAFHSARSTELLAARLAEILAREAPITLPLATRRLAELFQIARVTERVRQRVRDLCVTCGIKPDADFVLWRADQEPAHWPGFRPPHPDDVDPRQTEDLPLVEIANAAAGVLAQHVAMPMTALCQQTARQFGITRLGNAVRARIELGVRALALRGGAKIEGEQVTG